MGKKLNMIGTAVVTAILVSAFWIFAFNIRGAPKGPDGKVNSSGDVATVDLGNRDIAVAEGVEVGPAGLALPVIGVKPRELVDTFTQARAGGARVHDAIDIMAAEGTPVFAVADGSVEKLFDSVQGGLTLYQFEPSGRYAYYYAHLDRYAPGVVQGRALRQGELIGYVGSTGNANPDAPHLHFAVFLLDPERHWWEGTAINPYPLLGGR